MKTNHFSNQQQFGIRSIKHRRLRGSRLMVMIAIFLVLLAMLVGADWPVGAQDALPVGLAASSNPILPFGDPIIVEDDTGGEAIMGKPAVVGDGSKFLVVWRADNKDIRGARVAHDGTLLDPDGIDILVSPETSGFPTVGFDGTNFVVFFSHVPSGQSSWELYAVRVTPDGIVLDPSGVRLTTGASLKEYRVLGVAFDGTNFLVPWRTSVSDIYVARVSSAPANLDGPTGVLVSDNNVSWYPSVAFDGTNFLVTWHDGRNPPYDIYGARVTTPGAVLEPGGFLIASGPWNIEHEGIGFDGTNYLVVWGDDGPNPLPGAVYVYGTRVTPAGVILDDPPILVAENQWDGVKLLAVASDGDGFLVAWTAVTPSGAGADFRHADVFARRVSSAGAVLDTAAIPIAVAHWHQAQPTIGYDSGRFLVAWGQTDNEVAARLLARQEPPPSPTGSVGGPSDGGWAAETNPVTGGFYADLHALDSEHAYAGGGVPWPVGTTHIVKRDASGWSVDYAPEQTPYGVWAGGPDNIWVTGWCSAVFHFDGSTWSKADDCCKLIPSKDRIGENIWGDGEGTVLSANTDGYILRFGSNERWELEAHPVPNDLWDIWGSWRDDVWAVGANATLIHYDGQGWTRMAGIPTFQSINGVSGSSSDNVFAVGDFGTILHWDGTAWSAHNSGTLRHLFDVWVASDDEVYAVGLGGTILHYQSGVWTSEISTITNDLLGVSGVRDTASGVMAVWAGGQDVLLRAERPLAGDPVGVPDRYEMYKDKVLSIGAGDGVLSNDYDPEDNPLTAVQAESPRLGTLNLKSDGSFKYTPDPGVDGIDAFWYDVNDGNGGIDTVRVVIFIAAGAADDGPYYSEQGGSNLVASPGVLANDVDPQGDPLTAVLADGPAHGTVELQEDGSFVYTHDGSATTSDSFTYRASDGTSLTDPARVSWLIAKPRPEEGTWMYNPATGRFYARTVWLPFEEAERVAQAWGGHLVTINDQVEQDWLFVNFGWYYWIGLNDIDSEGTWVWTSGAPVAYTNWCSGAPDNTTTGKEAVHLSALPSGVNLCWKDISTDEGRFGIVESTVEYRSLFLPVLLQRP